MEGDDVQGRGARSRRILEATMRRSNSSMMGTFRGVHMSPEILHAIFCILGVFS